MAFQLFFAVLRSLSLAHGVCQAIRTRLTAAQLALAGADFAVRHFCDRTGNANTHVNLYVQGGMITHYHARSL